MKLKFSRPARWRMTRSNVNLDFIHDRITVYASQATMGQSLIKFAMKLENDPQTATFNLP